jgi:hypothetical protein
LLNLLKSVRYPKNKNNKDKYHSLNYSKTFNKIPSDRKKKNKISSELKQPDDLCPFNEKLSKIDLKLAKKKNIQIKEFNCDIYEEIDLKSLINKEFYHVSEKI